MNPLTMPTYNPEPPFDGKPFLAWINSSWSPAHFLKDKEAFYSWVIERELEISEIKHWLPMPPAPEELSA
jgi:hypothetical protein